MLRDIIAKQYKTVLENTYLNLVFDTFDLFHPEKAIPFQCPILRECRAAEHHLWEVARLSVPHSTVG